MTASRGDSDRIRWIVAVCLAAVGALLAGAAGVGGADETAAPDPVGFKVSLEPVVAGLDSVVLLVGPGDGTGDRYVVEQRGRILRIRRDGVLDPEPLLDISARVLDHNERGLLGLAFHPDFAENGRFFVAYSRRDDGATSISEFSVTGLPAPGGDGGSPEEPRPIESSERPLLVIAQPWTTHKSGMLAFDRDGMLLIGSGDGGSAWDPLHSGQDPASLLGKLLRIDVDRGWPYAIPADNGFSDRPGARGEVHAIGLRNPWRFSVDPGTGDIYIGDVGQDLYEEIDLLRPGERGVSFGWNDMDGDVCRLKVPCEPAGHRLPVVVYEHADGDTGHCAVIGGYAYRGAAGTLPDGMYLYADYCSGTIWAVPAEQVVAGTTTPAVVGRLDPALGQAEGFGQDDEGELYLLTSDGEVLHIREVAPSA